MSECCDRCGGPFNHYKVTIVEEHICRDCQFAEARDQVVVQQLLEEVDRLEMRCDGLLSMLHDWMIGSEMHWLEGPDCPSYSELLKATQLALGGSYEPPELDG